MNLLEFNNLPKGEVVTFNQWSSDQIGTQECATTTSNGNEWKPVDCIGTYNIVCMKGFNILRNKYWLLNLIICLYFLLFYFLFITYLFYAVIFIWMSYRLSWTFSLCFRIIIVIIIACIELD